MDKQPSKLLFDRGTFVSAPVPRLNNIFININSNQEKIHIHILTRYSHLYTALNSDCSNKINVVGYGTLVKWCYLHVQSFTKDTLPSTIHIFMEQYENKMSTCRLIYIYDIIPLLYIAQFHMYALDFYSFNVTDCFVLLLVTQKRVLWEVTNIFISTKQVIFRRTLKRSMKGSSAIFLVGKNMTCRFLFGRKSQTNVDIPSDFQWPLSMGFLGLLVYAKCKLKAHPCSPFCVVRRLYA